MLHSPHPASPRGAYRDRHETRGGERWPRMCRSTSWTCGRTAVGGREVAASWHPDAGVTPAVMMIRRSRGQESPVPGETAYKREDHRAGNAGMSRLHLWFLPRAFFPHGGHGSGRLPAFPAPS
jgi:hypothetical protein